MGSLARKMQLLLILVAFLLPTGAGAAHVSSSGSQPVGRGPFGGRTTFSQGSPKTIGKHIFPMVLETKTPFLYPSPGEIIGGQEALPHSHPYMAYLLIRTERGVRTCGGFLVREDFVMTSARCWGSRIRVILGAHNIRRQERTQQSIVVLRAIRHPRFNEQNNLNDIMLLQLENRARRNRFVRPVALPRAQARLSPGSLCTVAGWGLISQNRRTDRLRDVQLRVQQDQECSDLFDTYNGRQQICVGDRRERKATFLGDTGGPLVCNNVAQGIVSYGRSFGIPPTVFTRIARFLPWINKTMSQFN